MNTEGARAFADAAGRLYDERQFYTGRIATLGDDPSFAKEVAGYLRLVSSINMALSNLAMMSGIRDAESNGPIMSAG